MEWRGTSVITNKKSGKTSFKMKARDWSISVGTKHAMILLGELHEHESLSNLCNWESVQERCLIRGHSTNLPRASCPILLQTKNVEHFGRDHQGPPHHHNKIPTCASPGKAANGRDGCCHHNNLSNTCPDEASKGKGNSNHHVGGHHDNPPNASPSKASNGIRFSDHPCDGTPS